MPARSIIKNRHQLRQAREALKGLPPKEREALHWNGIGPGDGYIGFWKTVKYYRQKIAGIEVALRNNKLSAETRQELKADLRYYAEQVLMIYGKVIGFEKAKLQSITLKGDPDNPLHMNLDMNLDLSVLSDEELDVLARILPKLGGASGPASAAQNLLLEGGRGAAPPPRKPRARRDRA
jgi:hypothetical protein